MGSVGGQLDAGPPVSGGGYRSIGEEDGDRKGRMNGDGRRLTSSLILFFFSFDRMCCLISCTLLLISSGDRRGEGEYCQ